MANSISGLEINDIKDIGVRAKDAYFAKYIKISFMNKLIANLAEARYKC